MLRSCGRFPGSALDDDAAAGVHSVSKEYTVSKAEFASVDANGDGEVDADELMK